MIDWLRGRSIDRRVLVILIAVFCLILATGVAASGSVSLIIDYPEDPVGDEDHSTPRGIAIVTDYHTTNLEVGLNEHTDAVNVEVFDSDENQIAIATATNGVATFEGLTLNPGETYYITAGNTDSYIVVQSSTDYPVSGENLSATAGVSGTENDLGEISGWAYNIETVSGETFEPSDPALSSASPAGGDAVTETPVQLSIDVSDADFDTAQGDSVDVEFYRVVDDGSDELVGTHTLGQNGTATATMDDVRGGENEWYAVATDEYGGETTSDTFSFLAPSEIEIRDEMSLELIDDAEANLTVRFFREDSDEVVSRTATDGTANMSGLPADAEFVVTADADGYEPRRIIVSSIVEQSTIYLLPEDEDSVFNEFTLQDDTGNFPDAETKLIIQKAITTDEENQTQTFQTIAGDYFGATGTFPVVLAAQDRYRLIIENDAGQRRSLGAHTAEAGGPMPINVGRIEWPAPDQRDWGFSADYISDEEGTFIDIMYNDSSGDTSFLDLRVHERGNESNIIHEEATSDPQEFRAVVPLEGNQTETEWVVEYTITRNGETSTYSYIVGGDHEWQLPFDTELMGLFGLIGCVVIMAAYPGPLAPVGGVVVVGVSGVLLLVGIINIPIGAWFLAGTISVLGIVKAAEGVRFG